MNIFSNLLQNMMRTLYAMNFNNLILMLIIELFSFYLIRHLIVKKVKKKWSIIIWHPTLSGIIMKSLLAMHVFVAVYGIMIFCPIRVTEPDIVPVHALYEFVMNHMTDSMTLCLYNAVLMFPLGLWLGEVMKSARSKFLYKWTAILSGMIGLYMEYSQYVLGVGRPAADDVICIVLACCAGILGRDVFEKIKQISKIVNQLLKNEKKKRVRAQEKKAKEEEEKAQKAEEAEEKARLEREEAERKRQEQWEALAPYIEKCKESALYKKLSDLFKAFVIFILSRVQKLADLLADKESEDEFDEDFLEDDTVSETEEEAEVPADKSEEEIILSDPSSGLQETDDDEEDFQDLF